MMMQLLAETMIPGEWLIAAPVAIIGAIGSALLAYKKGVAASGEVTLKSPMPTVPTSKVPTPPSWDAHRALCDRVTRLEETTQELRRDMAGQYRELMMAGAAREQSISDKLDGLARGIHHRIDELMQPKRTAR